MNYQQQRNFSSYNQLPSFNKTHNPLENVITNQHPQYYVERQAINQNNHIKQPFNIKEYTFQMKQFFRPQPNVTNAPLTFNMQSPIKIKTKKGNRPGQKLTHKSFVNPFTKQLEDQFYKNQTNQIKPTLEDFSKTTTTVNGQSILNQQQIYTEPSEERIYTPLKMNQESQINTTVQHSNSLKILFDRKQSQSKSYVSNQFNQSYSNYQQPSEFSNSKSRDNTYALDQKFLLQEVKVQKQKIETYQKEIMKLNMEIKSLKSNEQIRKEEKDLLGSSRKENKYQNKQLQLQFQQNNKLLAQIQAMENDLKGKLELNRYLEHQCNQYNEKYEKTKKQFEDYKICQAQQSNKQEQIINILKRQVNDMEKDVNYYKIAETTRKDEISQLKKALQLQEEKNQERSTNQDIDKSEINVLTKRLQNFQAKYEKLMHSHCETEIKLHNFEEIMKQQRNKAQKDLQKLEFCYKDLEERYNKTVQEKQDIYMQLSSSKADLIKIQNENNELCQYYQEQYRIISQDLSQTNKIVTSKSQQIEQLNRKIQQKSQQIEVLHNRIKDHLSLKLQLKVKTQQNEKLTSILNDKIKESELLKDNLNLLSQDYNNKSSLLQQKTQQFRLHASQITAIKLAASQIEQQYNEIKKNYDSLQSNYENQIVRYKDLECRLIQNEFDYNILQKNFNQYTIKYSNLQKEYDNLKMLHNGLQALHNQQTAKSKSQLETLQANLRELSEKCEILECFKKESQTNQKKNQSNIHQLNQKYSQLEERLKQKCIQLQQIQQQLGELQDKYIKLQSKYEQLQNDQQASKVTQYLLFQSQKSEAQVQQILNKQLLEIESLRSTIESLEASLQAKQTELDKREEKDMNQSLLREEIASLMLIIQENEKRDQSQKQQLLQTINTLKEQISTLNHNFQSEILQHKSIIEALKQCIAELQKQDQLPITEQIQDQQQQTSQAQQKYEEESKCKKWKSLSQLNSGQQASSPQKMSEFQSAGELLVDNEVNYIQMDGEGVNYLCELLNIQINNGNILNQIVIKVQNVLNEANLSRKTVQSYRHVLDAFGIQEDTGSYELLLNEITNFKESLSIIIEQLKQEQMSHQALKIQYQNLRIIHQSEQIKKHRILHEFQNISTLNHDLNEIIVGLTATICNQKRMLIEAMSLAKQNRSCTSIRSDKFVTAKSLGLEVFQHQFENFQQV